MVLLSERDWKINYFNKSVILYYPYCINTLEYKNNNKQ